MNNSDRAEIVMIDSLSGAIAYVLTATLKAAVASLF
jgi:hypothetical protein